jgi:hypothetical protein
MTLRKGYSRGARTLQGRALLKDTTDVLRALDSILPDSTVLEDLSISLWNTDKDAAEVELGGQWVQVPRGTPLEIVTKAFLKEYFDVPFNTGYRVQVAVGGVNGQEFGILSAAICFATLYYNADRILFTSDFHTEMR